jgi:hypothetical protein
MKTAAERRLGATSLDRFASLAPSACTAVGANRSPPRKPIGDRVVAVCRRHLSSSHSDQHALSPRTVQVLRPGGAGVFQARLQQSSDARLLPLPDQPPVRH